MASRANKIFFGPDLSLPEARNMMENQKPRIQLLVVASSQHGFGLVWYLNNVMRIAWAPNLSGPWLMASIKPHKKSPSPKSQNPIDKLFRFLYLYPEDSLVYALNGTLAALPPRINPLPGAKTFDSLLDMTQAIGLEVVLVEYLVEAAEAAGFSLEDISDQLLLGPDVVTDFDMDAVELVKLWQDAQIVIQRMASEANAVTPYQVAVALGLDKGLPTNATLEEVVEVIRRHMK